MPVTFWLGACFILFSLHYYNWISFSPFHCHFKRLDHGSKAVMTRWCNLVWYISGSGGCFQKTGSQLKPPHRIVADPARTPVGRDDTVYSPRCFVLGSGRSCFRGTFPPFHLYTEFTREYQFTNSIKQLGESELVLHSSSVLIHVADKP